MNASTAISVIASLRTRTKSTSASRPNVGLRLDELVSTQELSSLHWVSMDNSWLPRPYDANRISRFCTQLVLRAVRSFTVGSWMLDCTSSPNRSRLHKLPRK